MKPSTEIWYVAYGSNLLAARFACYVGGGQPVGSQRSYRGCRDSTPPLDGGATRISHPLSFRHESSVWSGGTAFIDLDRPGEALGRRWGVTWGQFGDVVAQECSRDRLDLPDADLEGGRVTIEVRPGARYGTLVRLPDQAGRPAWTCTSGPGAVGEPNDPSPAYRAVVVAGLIESHALTVDAADGYVERAIAATQ